MVDRRMEGGSPAQRAVAVRGQYEVVVVPHARCHGPTLGAGQCLGEPGRPAEVERGAGDGETLPGTRVASRAAVTTLAAGPSAENGETATPVVPPREALTEISDNFAYTFPVGLITSLRNGER
ncbi:hypothetical protein CIB93_12065 [Streptomyces sp. WZ.A104]|nr:hypothetical protein CIB93_12065 [Streptomyces sp. WZ.A104]